MKVRKANTQEIHILVWCKLGQHLYEAFFFFLSQVLLVMGYFFSLTGLLVMLSAYVMAIGGVIASRKFYRRLLFVLIRSPMSFFDQTPMGRIMNRYTADIIEIDLVVPFTMRSMLNVILQTFSNLGVVIYTTPLFATVLPFFGVVYFIIQVVFVVRVISLSWTLQQHLNY